MFKSSLGSIFRNSFSENIFVQKYRHDGCETWENLCNVLLDDVCGHTGYNEEIAALKEIMKKGQFLAAGRYLYCAGRPLKAYNNCFMLRSETDTREDWAELSKKAELCLS